MAFEVNNLAICKKERHPSIQSNAEGAFVAILTQPAADDFRRTLPRLKICAGEGVKHVDIVVRSDVPDQRAVNGHGYGEAVMRVIRLGK